MSDEVQGREETKLANGGGAFPFWVSVVIVVGVCRHPVRRLLRPGPALFLTLSGSAFPV